jgi:hypothetical protein
VPCLVARTRELAGIAPDSELGEFPPAGSGAGRGPRGPVNVTEEADNPKRAEHQDVMAMCSGRADANFSFTRSSSAAALDMSEEYVATRLAVGCIGTKAAKSDERSHPPWGGRGRIRTLLTVTLESARLSL